MKKKLKLMAGILIVVFSMFLGCEKREKQQDELLLLPVEDVEDDSVVTEKDAEEETDNVQYCVVHICGAVNRPGVYTLEAKSRIYQAVARAGGFREDADQDYLNQADLVMDGMKIYIPTESEVESVGKANDWSVSGSSMEGDSLLVNINTAGEELLCTLPGVGSSKARNIIAYREKNGEFKQIEDIMNVEGIKDGLFQKIKDSITV